MNSITRNDLTCIVTSAGAVLASLVFALGTQVLIGAGVVIASLAAGGLVCFFLSRFMGMTSQNSEISDRIFSPFLFMITFGSSAAGWAAWFFARETDAFPVSQLPAVAISALLGAALVCAFCLASKMSSEGFRLPERAMKMSTFGFGFMLSSVAIFGFVAAVSQAAV